MLSVSNTSIMLSIVMLNVIMLSVITPSVFMGKERNPFIDNQLLEFNLVRKWTNALDYLRLTNTLGNFAKVL